MTTKASHVFWVLSPEELSLQAAAFNWEIGNQEQTPINPQHLLGNQSWHCIILCGIFVGLLYCSL